SCLNSVYRVRESRHSSDGTSYLMNEILDTGSVQLSLFQDSFDRLGIRLYFTRAVNLTCMNRQQLNELPDLIYGFLFLGIGIRTISSLGVITYGNILCLNLPHVIPLIHH